MLDVLQNTVDGLMFGSSYALLAIGFTLIFGVMRRLNLSYGPAIVVGIFAGAFVAITWNAGLVAVAAATIAGSVLAGLYVERLCFGAHARGAVLAPMVASFAVWMQLEEATTLVFPGRTYTFPTIADTGVVELGQISLRTTYLVMFAASLFLILLLNLILYRTRFGLALRAVSEDAEAARHLGLNVTAVAIGAFVLASIVGGVAGFLIAGAEGTVTPKLGLWATMKGMIAMMLGGMGSVAGAVAGGLLLGVVEAQSAWYLGTEYRDLAAFVLLLAFLVLRPGGLLAQRSVGAAALGARRV